MNLIPVEVGNALGSESSEAPGRSLLPGTVRTTRARPRSMTRSGSAGPRSSATVGISSRSTPTLGSAAPPHSAPATRSSSWMRQRAPSTS